MDSLFELNTKYGIVRGIYSKPSLDKFPVVLVLHGFSGESIGPKYLLRTFQKKVVENNIGVLRFDYNGCGNSDGEFINNTVTNSIEQGQEVLEFLKLQPEVSKIYAVGFSMGGLVASELAKKNPDTIEKLLLWSPAGNLGDLLQLFYDSLKDEGKDYRDFGALDLSLTTVNDALSYDAFSGLDAYKKEVCIVHGSLDSAVPIEVGRKYYDAFTCKKSFIEVTGSEHTYEQNDWRELLYTSSINFLVE